MSGETNLVKLLSGLRPSLSLETYVFACVTNDKSFPSDLKPLMIFREDEGVTLILKEQDALAASLDAVFQSRRITLGVHSALEAVGLMAAVTARLASAGISVNPVSGFFHDHLFVPTEQAEEALAILSQFAGQHETRRQLLTRDFLNDTVIDSC